MNEQVLERFWSKVDQRGPGECWLWKAGGSKGYGYFRLNGRPHTAHRVAWLAVWGKVPDGFVVRHTCGRRDCCNPIHLYLQRRGAWNNEERELTVLGPVARAG